MIQKDSRKVKKGDTFIDLSNNSSYVWDAISKGAKKVIVKNGEYPVITEYKPNPRKYFVNYLKRYYYKKIKDITLIGITGTNGKTTTSFLIYQSLLLLHKKCAYIGTIGFYKNNEVTPLQNTTPDIGDLYEMLIECKKDDISYVVMEVSSQALSMHRTDTLLFDYVIFTNLTEDHLDYHKTMENYVQCKQKLFTMTKKDNKQIVNIDDPYHTYFLNENSITYGFQTSDYQFSIQKQDTDKTLFYVNNNLYETHLLGKYNVYNVGVCILLLEEMGYTYPKLKNIIPKLLPPKGRMEKISYQENQIIIDYAHTPDAVENILTTIRNLPVHNLITIIGCGGNRDKQKRPIMGNIATTLSDYVIFTSDNPREEDPEKIIEDMTQFLKNENYEIVINRENAIKKGIQMLAKNDILLILGKGHENYQIIKTKKIKFSDYETVIHLIRR